MAHHESDSRPGPRVPPVDRELSTGELAAMWDDVGPPDVRGLARLNIVRTLAHHPDLLTRYMTFGLHLLRSSTLPDRLRTIVSLRTAAVSGSEYEWSKHAQVAAGGHLTSEEIEATRSGTHVASWSELERHVLSAVDQLCASNSIEDQTWEGMAAQLETRQLLDLVFTVANYAMLAMVIHGLRVETEE